MDTREVIQKADWLLKRADAHFLKDLRPAHFPEFASLVADVVRRGMSPSERSELPWLREWSERFAALYDDYEYTIKRDPMAAYRPKHDVAARFHASRAFGRYFKSGNGTSKTQSGYAEDYFAATGTHPHGLFPPHGPTAVAIIGLGFTKYAPNVFEAKMLDGENGNFLSPMFPEGGKWLHSYDKKTRKIWVACKHCAEADKASSCPHPKSSITLFSDEGDWEIFQGATYRLVHIDEHVREEFFSEAQQRIIRINDQYGGRMVITGTPLFGPDAWEIKRLLSVASGDPKENRWRLNDPTSPALFEVFEIDQYAAGIVPHEAIEASKKTMDEFEIEARIYGRAVPLSKNPVFDRKVLQEIRSTCRTPTFGQLDLATKDPDQNLLYTIEEIAYPSDVAFREVFPNQVKGWTGLRVWELPQPGAQYLIPADIAAGLSASTHDASCAPVLKLFDKADGSIGLEMVAQFHGWISPFEYADEIKKLGIFYNTALVVPETNGIGRTVMLRLKEQTFYPNLFRDTRVPEYFEPGEAERFGVDTNTSTKPAFVATLQQMLRHRLIQLYDLETVEELVAFDQERTESGLTTRYRGGGGARDDRVMALAIGAWVSQRFLHQFNFLKQAGAAAEKPRDPRIPRKSSNPFWNY